VSKEQEQDVTLSFTASFVAELFKIAPLRWHGIHPNTFHKPEHGSVFAPRPCIDKKKL